VIDVVVDVARVMEDVVMDFAMCVHQPLHCVVDEERT